MERCSAATMRSFLRFKESRVCGSFWKRLALAINQARERFLSLSICVIGFQNVLHLKYHSIMEAGGYQCKKQSLLSTRQALYSWIGNLII